MEFKNHNGIWFLTYMPERRNGTKYIFSHKKPQLDNVLPDYFEILDGKSGIPTIKYKNDMTSQIYKLQQAKANNDIWRNENRNWVNERARMYYRNNPEKFKEYENKPNRKERLAELRLIVLKYYSPSLVCACCGENHYGFLTLDHINNDGGKHRRELNIRSKNSGYIYRWIIENNYPAIFQVLCYNCNCSRAHKKQCPHELERQKTQEQILNRMN